MVNALGGVQVCIPYAVTDSQSHLDLEKGIQNVRGRQALAYVRTRHGLGDGSDLSRIERQQAFLSSMVSKVKDKGLLLRPVKLYNFLAAATNSITTDVGGLRDMANLARDVRGLETSNIDFVTVPNEPYTLDPNRVQWKDSATALWRSLRFDQPLPGKEPATPSASSTASPSPTGPPLVTPPENVRVQVLNGSGTAGEASRVAKDLTAAGFQVVGRRQRRPQRLRDDRGALRPGVRRVRAHPGRRDQRVHRDRGPVPRQHARRRGRRRPSDGEVGRGQWLDGVAAGRGDHRGPVGRRGHLQVDGPHQPDPLPSVTFGVPDAERPERPLRCRA